MSEFDGIEGFAGWNAKLNQLLHDAMETAQQEALGGMGCDLGQGFLYSAPVSAAEIDRVLAGEDVVITP